MAEDELILTPIANAASSLRRAILVNPRDEFVRDAIVQRFEYTYELAWKFMRRRLLAQGVETNTLTRRDLFREAAKAGLIDDPVAWFDFTRARNLVSHTYNEVTALEVVAVAEAFLPAVETLIARLEKLNDDSA
ncbi:MAG: nucleotidyltransferase substrate binding protein [Alphaproteobacteria bacterium]|nr:nucleotidyltransferase substrate binding protein [Alphaproteobacteria bacterium]MCW5743556.1 nucleotidyltransferase substrate binding protein [Alphaproteobacteria bacterium]